MKKNIVFILVGMVFFVFNNNAMASKYKGGVNADCYHGVCEGDYITVNGKNDELYKVERVFLSGNIEAVRSDVTIGQYYLGFGSTYLTIHEISAIAKKQCEDCTNRIYDPLVRFNYDVDKVRKEGLSNVTFISSLGVLARLSDGRYAIYSSGDDGLLPEQDLQLTATLPGELDESVVSKAR